MELSVLIAKLYGTVAIAMGLGMIFNAKYYQEAFGEMTKNKTYIFLGGIAALVIGLLIVVHHNIWEASWVVLITLIGWIAVIKGFALLVFPKFAKYFESWFQNTLFFVLAGTGSLVFGLVLCYFSGNM